MHGLVRRHGPTAERPPTPEVEPARQRRDDLDRQHADPEGRQHLHGVGLHELLLHARGRRQGRGLRQLHLPCEGRRRGAEEDGSCGREEPVDLPDEGDALERAPVRRPSGAERQVQDAVRSADRFMRLSRRATPYLLLAPGLAWLAVFFVVPMYYLFNTSLQTGSLDVGYTFSWAWSNYKDALTLYQDQFIRSIQYAGIATIFALLISYPLAYWIALKSGRWKNLFLLMVVAPFFVTYLIRTLAWETILSDNGFVVHALQNIGVLGANGRLLATSTAVIAGITYNFLPFMVLPLYVSLEQMDESLIEAAQDL